MLSTVAFVTLMNFVAAESRSALAILLPDVASNQTVKGTLDIDQEEGGQAKFTLNLEGLAPSTVHGWHIHDKPVTGQNCTTAGLHFNPKNVTHGAPDAEVRHYGDFGNFKTDENGEVNDYVITDRLASLFGEFVVTGRGVVIHALQDDLGLVDNAGSKSVGNAGARLACGNIVIPGEVAPTVTTSTLSITSTTSSATYTTTTTVYASSASATTSSSASAYTTSSSSSTNSEYATAPLPSTTVAVVSSAEKTTGFVVAAFLSLLI